MSQSLRIQENVYSTYKMLKTRKKQLEFLEKIFIFAWENREIPSSFDVELAFSGVKPSIKLTNNGGGNNNPDGINQHKNNNLVRIVLGQSEVRVRSDSGQSFINNKYKEISNKYEDDKTELNAPQHTVGSNNTMMAYDDDWNKVFLPMAPVGKEIPSRERMMYYNIFLAKQKDGITAQDIIQEYKKYLAGLDNTKFAKQQGKWLEDVIMQPQAKTLGQIMQEQADRGEI